MWCILVTCQVLTNEKMLLAAADRLAGTGGKVNVLSPKTTCCVCFKDGMFYARMCLTKTTNAFCGEDVQTEQH